MVDKKIGLVDIDIEGLDATVDDTLDRAEETPDGVP